MNSGNWNAAVDTLQLLEEYYPFGAYAEQAQLELIYSYYQAREFESAIAAADRFIRLHPQHRSVDYAYYMKGIASYHSDTAITKALVTDVTNRDSGTSKEAFNHFNLLIQKYPKSSYALDAQKRMIYLRNIIARYEIHVANYYFRRGAFIAAANRGRYVVENMQNTPAVPDGLAVMAQAYHLLEMPELAKSATKVLATNFPDHPALDADGNFKYTYKLKAKRTLVNYLTLGLLNKKQYVSFDTRSMYNTEFKSSRGNPALLPPPS